MQKNNSRKAVIGRTCVACGTCEGVCPNAAVHVFRGVRAVVDNTKCIGCGKCAKVCPAGIIKLEREATHETQMV